MKNYTEKINEIIQGTLLGDGCIFLNRGKYARYKLTAKDANFINWVRKIFTKSNLKNYSSFDKRNRTNILYSSANSLYLSLRKGWYKRDNGKTQKIIPRSLKLTSVVLLFWYLGDGSLVRRRNDSNRVPTIVLATNSFSKEDLIFLIEKLKTLCPDVKH